MLVTPILFLVFNRPDLTKITFSKIRELRPKKLFINADGPRDKKKGEYEICSNVRKIVSEVDWECEIHTRFLDKNLGCKYSVSSGISWFFENVEEGIIIEDDILPDASFFKFCEILLDRYKDDTRVMQICGTNAIGTPNIDSSYYFSKYGPVWGWATWRRAWNFYDIELSSWQKIKNKKSHYAFCENREEIYARETLFDSLFENKIDTWDFQWGYSKLINSGLSIIPKYNLIKNLGFREDATHTTNIKDINANLFLHEIEFPLTFNDNVLRDWENDMIFCDRFIIKEKSKFYSFISNFRDKFCDEFGIK